MDISQLSPGETRVRLEDVIKILDEIGVPEHDTPAQRVRALGLEFERSLRQRQKVLDAAVPLAQEREGARMLATAMWNPFPDVPPPDDRDVIVSTANGTQVVVRFDPKPCGFFTTCGTRIWIRNVVFWRECLEEPVP